MPIPRNHVDLEPFVHLKYTAASLDNLSSSSTRGTHFPYSYASTVVLKIPSSPQSGRPGSVTMDQSLVDATLFSYDLLLHLFENIRLCGESGSSTLASCTRVCRAWGEPASYVLWRDLASFRPLWNLLAGRDFSGEAKYLSAYWQVRLGLWRLAFGY